MAIGDPPRERVDRDEIFIETTKSICPVCKIVLDAEVNVRDNKVFLRRRCPDHGEIEGLIYGDAEMYFDSLKFNKPGTLTKALQKCCVEEITPDGRLIPFCTYNSVGYREQVREQLRGVAIPTIVPNAEELQPTLLTTKYGSKTFGNGDGDEHVKRSRTATNVGKKL